MKTADIQKFNLSVQAVLDGRCCFACVNPKAKMSPAPLTKKQAEILSLVEAGLAATHIADRFDAPLSTVQKHLSALLHTLRGHGEDRAHQVSAEFYRSP